MAEPLLTTKLYMPPFRTGLVARPRLTARLTAALQRPYWNHGNLHAVLADVLRVQGDLAGAEAEAQAGLKANELWSIPHGMALAMHALFRVLLATGREAEGRALLARLAPQRRRRDGSAGWRRYAA